MWASLIWAIFFLIIIFLFKSQIKGLIDTLINLGNKSKKISYMGFNIDLGTSSTLAPTETQAESRQHELMKAFQSQIVTNEEKTIRTQLINAGLTHEKAINILIYQLANKNLLIQLLIIDKLIFPQQVDLLINLNIQAKPSSESNLLHYYTEWKNAAQNVDYTFEQFLKFLQDNGLILQGIYGYTISLLGKEYLKYLVNVGRDVNVKLSTK